MGWGIKDILGKPFDPITNAIDTAAREVLHQMGGVFDSVASAMDDLYNMVYSTNVGVITGVRKGNIGVVVAIIVILLLVWFMPALLALVSEMAAAFASVMFTMLAGMISVGALYAFAFGAILGVIIGFLLVFIVPGSFWVYLAAASPWLSAVLYVLSWVYPALAPLFTAISACLSAIQVTALVVFVSMGLPGDTIAPEAFDWQAEAKMKSDLIAQLIAAGYTASSAGEYLDNYARTGVWDPRLLVGYTPPGQVVDIGAAVLPPSFPVVNNPSVSSTNTSLEGEKKMLLGAALLLLSAAMMMQ